jgi:hypothetical protein
MHRHLTYPSRPVWCPWKQLGEIFAHYNHLSGFPHIRILTMRRSESLPTCLGLTMTRCSLFIIPPLNFLCLLNPYSIRQPSRLEGLSRTVRNYVPTSISIAVPSASPSPPRVSLPISFGRFMSPTHQSAPLDGMGTDRRQSWGMETGATSLDEVLTLDHQTGQTSAQRSDLPRYPGSDDSECITWARWDALLPDGGGPTM